MKGVVYARFRNAVCAAFGEANSSEVDDDDDDALSLSNSNFFPPVDKASGCVNLHTALEIQHTSNRNQSNVVYRKTFVNVSNANQITSTSNLAQRRLPATNRKYQRIAPSKASTIRHRSIMRTHVDSMRLLTCGHQNRRTRERSSLASNSFYQNIHISQPKNKTNFADAYLFELHEQRQVGVNLEQLREARCDALSIEIVNARIDFEIRQVALDRREERSETTIDFVFAKECNRRQRNKTLLHFDKVRAIVVRIDFNSQSI